MFYFRIKMDLAKSQRMLPLGLCLRPNVRQGEGLFWPSFRRYNTTTSKSPTHQFSCNKFSAFSIRCLRMNEFNGIFIVYVFFSYSFHSSIGWIYPNRYSSKSKVNCAINIFIYFYNHQTIHPNVYNFFFWIFHSHSDVEPIVFSFRVKFFPADPFRLTGNSKILIYQQLKRDLIHGRLYCSAGEAAALGSLIVQGKEMTEIILCYLYS